MADKTTAELTVDYIREHPYILFCLQKGLVNYSALARLISKELNIEKRSSLEAVLVSARRFKEKIGISYEVEVKKLLSKSELDIKTKIVVFILKKDISLDSVELLQKKTAGGVFFLLEGSDNFTLITQDRFYGIVKDKFSGSIIKQSLNLVLINVKSPEEIESTYGVLSYLTSLFAQNGVNIVEFVSCWKDTIFVISASDLNKAVGFLSF